MLKIVAVEYRINSAEVLNTTFDSGDTFLDGDIVVINPAYLNRLWENAREAGDGLLRLFSTQQSDGLRQIFNLRKKEISTLLDNGRVVFVFMSPVSCVLAEIRNNNKFLAITNYSWLSTDIMRLYIKSISQGSGSVIILKTPSHPISPYYKAFKDELTYEAYLDIKDENSSNFFLVNKSGNPVGCSFEVGKGLLIFVPPPPLNVEASKLIGVLIQCAKPIITGDFLTPEPEWADNYPIPGEVEICKEIEQVQKNIAKLNQEFNQLELKRKSLSDFRALLFEQGKPLEDAVIRAIELMGFSAKRVQKEDMEHDIVLESPEGRALAEIEGRDNDAIHVEKLDQLTRVIDEDFNENDIYSEGVLIGNAYRFTLPNDRKDQFTNKVRIAAKRKEFGLLTTIELFNVVVRILKNPSNEDFKIACRKAILIAKGKEIMFPVV